MKLSIKTKHVCIEVEDNIVFGSGGMISHNIPSLTDAIKNTLAEVLNVHMEIEEEEHRRENEK